jgi:hypothetical protein
VYWPYVPYQFTINCFNIQKHLTLKALETFTGWQLADEIINNINHPCNAFNAESSAHDSYKQLAWGIEAVQDSDQVNIILQ